MSKKIIITGATGLIGKKISRLLIDRGDKVVIFSRSPQKAAEAVPGADKYIEWDYKNSDSWKDLLNSADFIIHLAGASVMGGRWTERYKKIILESRVISTRSLVKAIADSQQKPQAFICASAVGYYPYSATEEFTEDSAPGDHFLSDVTEQWENESAKVEAAGVRRVNIRTGIVLDKHEGALAKMLTPFKFFLGGALGSGQQWFPWIHIDDIAGIYLHAIDNDNVYGALNGTAPEFINMNTFCKNLGKATNRPSFFKVPSFILNLILGKGAEAVLNGAKIKPQRTLGFGYKFQFEKSIEALNDIIN